MVSDLVKQFKGLSPEGIKGSHAEAAEIADKLVRLEAQEVVVTAEGLRDPDLAARGKNLVEKIKKIYPQEGQNTLVAPETHASLDGDIGEEGVIAVERVAGSMRDYLNEAAEERLDGIEGGHLIKIAFNNRINILGREIKESEVDKVLSKMEAMSMEEFIALEELLIKHGALIEDKKDYSVESVELKGEGLKALSNELGKQFPIQWSDKFEQNDTNSQRQKLVPSNEWPVKAENKMRGSFKGPDYEQRVPENVR